MRWVVYALVALVALKLYGEDWLHRSATEQALQHAFTKDALSACRQDRTHPLNAKAPKMWDNPHRVSVIIGDPGADVALWQLTDPNWDRAHATAFLLITPADRHSGITCLFDLASGTARLQVPN